MESPIVFASLIPVITTFIMIFGISFAVKSALKGISKQIPMKSIKEIQMIAKQFPKGVSWKHLKKDWDLKIDRETGKLTIKKKTTAGMEGDSTLGPTEIQVTQLAQLPGVLRKLINATDEDKQSNTGVAFKTNQTPTSASSAISAPKAIKYKRMRTPVPFETTAKIKRVLLILLVLFAFAILKRIFG